MQVGQAGAEAVDRLAEALSRSAALETRVTELTAELAAAHAQVTAGAALKPAAAPLTDEVTTITTDDVHDSVLPKLRTLLGKVSCLAFSHSASCCKSSHMSGCRLARAFSSYTISWRVLHLRAGVLPSWRLSCARPSGARRSWPRCTSACART